MTKRASEQFRAPKLASTQIPAEVDLAAVAQPTEVRQRPLHALLARVSCQMSRTAGLVGVPLVWLGVIAFCGGTGYAAFNWLFTIPPIPDCDRIWFFSLDSDKLFCAEQAVRSGKVEAVLSGLKLVEQWSPNHQLHPHSQQLQREWSKKLLQIAREQALRNELSQAIELAEAIKPGNPVYRDAKNAVLEWEKLRDRDQSLTAKVEAALKAHNWQRAEAALQPPGAGRVSAYQQQQFNRLKERITTERMAFNQLRQLRELVKTTSAAEVATLGRAIQLAAKISPSSYVNAQAQTDVKRWSGMLVEMAEKRLIAGDVRGAIAVAEWIPTGTALPAAVQDLRWVSQSPQLSSSQTATAPPHRSLWQLTTSLAALKQVQPQSLLYSQAQAKIPALERQVQDLSHLSLADAVASVPQIPALQLAIQMAQSVTRDRPHRLDAQTLIADWRRDIQRIEDRPLLTQAQRLAKPGKVKALQAAIAQAQKIPLGRALRPEAQATIFAWKQRIQIIEDLPTLNQARQLAAQKQLAAAIQQADQILPDRALYPEAQTAIQRWVRLLQVAEDQPTLNQARQLATQGSLGAAIDLAYQISPDRALYNEAQTAIATWTTQLAATRRRWYPNEPRRDYLRYPDRERGVGSGE